MHNILKTICPIISLAVLSVASLRAQYSAQLVQIPIPLKASCTAPTATVTSGAKYTNTCTITQGTPPLGLFVSTLPPGLTSTKTSNTITITGTPPVGQYTYYVNFSGGGYTSSFILVGLNVVASTTTSTAGNGTIRCIQKGGPRIPDPPLCQACVITAESGRICDRDDNFNPTGKTPQAPAGARVGAVYMNSAPLTYNVQGYTLTVSHKDITSVSKQIAYETPGKNPAYATQSVPAVEFDGQLVEADGGRWSFNFSPLMIDSSLFAQWGVDFLYNINWRVSSQTTKSSSRTTESELAPEARGLSATLEKPELVFSVSSKLAGASDAHWNAVASADLTGDGIPDVLVQDLNSGAVAVWSTSGSQITEKIDLSSNPGPGWTLAAAADLTGDGMTDLIFQNDASGLLDVWQMVETNVIAKLRLAEIPPAGWKVVGAGVLTVDGAVSLILQEQTGAIHVWTMSGLDVAARSEVANVPASGWRVRAITDLTGDGVPDLLVEKAGHVAVWQMLDGRILQARDAASSWDANTKVVGLWNDGTFLVQSETDGSIGTSQLEGALSGKRLIEAQAIASAAVK
jgi:FG-GAP-like repeat